MLSLHRHPSRLTWGSDGNPVYRSEFLGGAHFDDDVPPALQTQVTRRAGCRHIERYPMVLSGDGQLVRADLVGCVTVSNHPVCTHHHSWGRKQQKGSLKKKKKREVLVKWRRRDGTQTHTCDVHLPHGESCHAVCYKRGRDSLRYSLVRRQSGPLVVRPRLCAVHALQPAQRVEASHHAYTQTHISYSALNISTTTFFSHSEPALQSHPAPSRIQLWPASRCCSVWGWSQSPWGRQKGCAELHSYRSSCCHWRHAPACLRSRQLHCRRGATRGGNWEEDICLPLWAQCVHHICRSNTALCFCLSWLCFLRFSHTQSFSSCCSFSFSAIAVPHLPHFLSLSYIILAAQSRFLPCRHALSSKHLHKCFWRLAHNSNHTKFKVT